MVEETQARNISAFLAFSAASSGFDFVFPVSEWKGQGIGKSAQHPDSLPLKEFLFKKFFQRQEKTGQNDSENQGFQKGGGQNEQGDYRKRHQNSGASSGMQHTAEFFF